MILLNTIASTLNLEIYLIWTVFCPFNPVKYSQIKNKQGVRHEKQKLSRR